MAKLEQLENVQLAHPFNKGFEYETVCGTEDEALRVAHDGHHLGLGTTNGVPADVTFSGETDEKPEKIDVFTTSFYVGLVLDTSEYYFACSMPPMLIRFVGQAKKFDISWACQEFYDLCKTWNLYNEDLHSISVLYCRAYVILAPFQGTY